MQRCRWLWPSTLRNEEEPVQSSPVHVYRDLETRVRSIKVIENDIIRSGTHDFLLTFIVTIGLPCTVSEINGDLSRKSQIFPPPVYFAPPLKGFPCNWVSAQGSEKTGMMGLPDGFKRFKIGLATQTQYRCVTDREMDRQPRCHSKDRISRRRAGNKKLS